MIDILEILFMYLLVGCLIDYLYSQVERELEERNLLNGKLYFWDRIMGIALWPIGLSYFLIGFIRATFFDDDNT
tara:strand:- start:258 stop:479 length:222 start_codon:yes stop_codon:yes gene_type:complete